METPKRLTPRADVTRRLYLASGNRCAFPPCEQALMGSDAVLVGEIAHIEGALPDSARFNAAMTNEQRRHYDNLLLMCGTHHTVIDSDETTWTVAKLKDLKRAHEAIYTAAIDKLRQQVGDVTDGVTYTPAANGLAILDGQGLDPNELEVSRQDINGFAERLSRIPVDARSLLALIVDRGEKTPGHVRHSHWSVEFQIPVRVLKSLADCTATQLRQHVEVLEHFDLLQRDDEPFDGPPLYIVGNSTPGIGWALLQDIHDLDTPERPVVRRVLCDLDFTALDQDATPSP
jgi:hypothetical protein